MTCTEHVRQKLSAGFFGQVALIFADGWLLGNRQVMVLKGVDISTYPSNLEETHKIGPQNSLKVE